MSELGGVPAFSMPPGGAASAGGGIGGSTGGTDNALLRSDGTGGATLQSTGIIVDDNNGVSGALQGRKAGAGSTTLVAADSGKLVTLTAGSGDDEVALPAAPTLGTWYDFAIISTDELTVRTQGSHVIRVGAAASSAGGTFASSTLGSFLHLVYAATNLWVGVTSGVWVAL